ncbi:cytochrome P450 2A3-like [Dermacentor albipictus]|uniref:cytochrome P450 2A3-like n=1 Tax=Dermacentor albipictus TaxID=60249 RepID=UPI0038FCDD3B
MKKDDVVGEADSVMKDGDKSHVASGSSKSIEVTDSLFNRSQVKTGSTDVVIINDFQLIKKYLPKKELMNRPQNWFFNEGEYAGLATFNGDVWMDNRRFSMQVLRDVGYGKTSMEEHVKGECHSIVEKISRANGNPISVYNLLLTSMSSNIASLVYGTRHAHDDPHRLYMDKMLLDVFEAIGHGSMLEFLPMFVRQLLRKLPSTRRSAMASKVKTFIQYTKGQIEEHKQTLDNDSNRDFIDGYLKKIKEHEKEPKSNFTPCYLVGNAMALFFGGSRTVTAALQWHFLNFADKPDTVQARVQEEIDRVVGRERQPTWEDRQKMHYTMACIWEMNRWKTVSPLGVPRCVLEDTVFDEFYIPSGTTVVPNLWAVHNDPKLWKEPSKFNPSRFLGADGSLIHPKPEYLIPFSVGKSDFKELPDATEGRERSLFGSQY